MDDVLLLLIYMALICSTLAVGGAVAHGIEKVLERMDRR
jgi:hypothetical protein